MQLIDVITQLNPLWILITIISGLLVGIVIRKFPFDQRTVISLLLITFTFGIPRLLILLLFGTVVASGSGSVGSILFMIFLPSIYFGRKLGRKLLGG